MAKQLALHCERRQTDSDDHSITLVLDPKHAGMQTAATTQRLLAALQDHYRNDQLKLTIELGQQTAATPAQHQAERRERQRQDAVQLIQQDPNVQALQQVFSAEVKTDSIKPTD